MALSNKQSLINYLEFLKENGFLYMDMMDIAAIKSEPPISSTARATPQPAPRPGPAQKSDPAKILPREERVKRLMDAAARAEACRACPLGSQRHKLVFSDGDPMARLVFVGEAPGGEEDATGIPFVGAAGQLLNKMLPSIGFKREEVYICNTLKCRPPHNRDPLPAEKAACEHFLLEQLQILRPGILVALGAHAAQYLCNSEEGIGRLRGRWHAYHGIPLLATFHPAYLLRNASNKGKSWDDFKLIHAKYTELYPDDPRPLWSKKENAS